MIYEPIVAQSIVRSNEMKQKCQACGVEKDADVIEIYPYPNDGVVHGQPIDPFFTIDCQGKAGDWRTVTVCHACFHKLDIDAWITEQIWEALKPITPFEQLPKLINPVSGYGEKYGS